MNRILLEEQRLRSRLEELRGDLAKVRMDLESVIMLSGQESSLQSLVNLYKAVTGKGNIVVNSRLTFREYSDQAFVREEPYDRTLVDDIASILETRMADLKEQTKDIERNLETIRQTGRRGSV